tara:strand:- start:346 stop:819 length:474 start_codon:yes stop_codon:yes gene_type:complete
MIKKYFLNFFIIIFIFFLDRISKLLVINYADANGEMYKNVTSFLDINLIWNEGIAFGLFSFNNELYYNLLTIFILLIILIIVLLMFKSKGFEKLCYIMIIGGSLGNIFDRIYYSAVPDFIDIYFNNFHWFIFNVADIFISIGVIILISLEFFKKKNV